VSVHPHTFYSFMRFVLHLNNEAETALT
jgi:hypothetical protein